MDIDLKWYMIGVAVMMLGMFVSLAYSDHVKTECKIEAIKNHMTVADANEMCK